MIATAKRILSIPYAHYVIFFSAGAGLELFMNHFQVGDISIYRVIKRNLSDTRAQEQFDLERAVFERYELSGEEKVEVS